MKQTRRAFVQSAVTAAVSAALVAAPAAFAAQNPSASTTAASGASPSQFFHVTVRGDLRSPGTDLELRPGEISERIDLGSVGVFRVCVTPNARMTPFGPSYSLVVADADGKQVAQMNIGSNTTATFTQLGVQVYMLSVVIGA